MKEYSPDGKLVKEHGESKFAEIFDEAYSKVRKDNPFFTAGFIFFGLRSLSDE